MDKMEVVSFVKKIPANTTQRFEEDVNDDATIERIRVKFYQSQAKQLQINAFLLRNGEVNVSLVTPAKGTDTYMSGDDEELDLQITIPAAKYDKIVVMATNTSATEDYTCNVFITIDYYGGANRVVK